MLVCKDNISTFQDAVHQLLWLNSHIKYNKTVLYALSPIQQGTMMIAVILNADLKIPTLNHFHAKFNLEWQKNTCDKCISAIQIEWRTLIQSKTSSTFI